MREEKVMGNRCGGLTKSDSGANQLYTFCDKMTEFADMEKAGAIYHLG